VRSLHQAASQDLTMSTTMRTAQPSSLPPRNSAIINFRRAQALLIGLLRQDAMFPFDGAASP
jgi:hypothetical protein